VLVVLPAVLVLAERGSLRIRVPALKRPRVPKRPRLRRQPLRREA
jgi:hypothetical protein